MRVNDGKWYVSRTGFKPFKLIGYDSYTKEFLCEYESGVTHWWCKGAIVPFEGETLNEIEEQLNKETDMLYQIKGEDKYVTKLAVNSAGQWVVEEKGTGDILSVDKDKLEEVIPHSVCIKFSNNEKEYHYLCPKGVVSKGDTLMVDASCARVTKVDTKSKRATTELLDKDVVRIITEPLVKEE